MSLLRKLFSRERESPEAAFWRWFSENAERYRTFQAGDLEQDPLLRELSDRLSRVHRKLQFELGIDKPNGGREMVISADGNVAVFPAVQRLIQAAPSLPGWTFLAFRQRKDLDEISLEFEETKVQPADLWFALRSEGDRIGVDLYLPGQEDPTGRTALTICFLMLDCALGEFDVETKVGSLNTYPLPPDPGAQSLKPFPSLPQEFDALYRLMHG